MKYLVCGILAACCAVSTAQAQSYSGPYVGVEGGWDNYEVGVEDGDLDYLLDIDGEASFDGLSGDGFGGGIFAGYHYGMENTFIAVEGFLNYSDASISGSVTDEEFDYTARAQVKAKESYGVAARVGVKVNNATAVYARGGWVQTRFDYSESDNDGYSFSFDDTADAFQYGVGLETMIGPKMSLRAEYVMADYGDAGLGEGIEVDSNAFKGGVALRF